MPSDHQFLINRFDDPPWTLRGVVGGLVLLLVVAVALAHQAAVAATLRFVLDNLIAMAPVILLAVGLAAGLGASGADTALAEAVRARPRGMVLVAAAAGAVTPICGVGVLPLIAALLRSGVPLAPVMAFWLASPVTDPAMFAITATVLGIGFAVAKTALAFLIGIAGGMITQGLDRAGMLARPLRGQAVAPCCADGEPRALSLRFWRDAERRARFARDASSGAAMITFWLGFAFAVESLMRAHVPAETVASLVGQANALAVPFAVLVGAPVYVDGYGALPLVRGLIELGMTPGAAMGFLLAGGIVSLYASIAVFALVRLSVFLLYIALALSLSLLGALAFELISS